MGFEDRRALFESIVVRSSLPWVGCIATVQFNKGPQLGQTRVVRRPRLEIGEDPREGVAGRRPIVIALRRHLPRVLDGSAHNLGDRNAHDASSVSPGRKSRPHEDTARPAPLTSSLFRFNLRQAQSPHASPSRFTAPLWDHAPSLRLRLSDAWSLKPARAGCTRGAR